MMDFQSHIIIMNYSNETLLSITTSKKQRPHERQTFEYYKSFKTICCPLARLLGSSPTNSNVSN